MRWARVFLSCVVCVMFLSIPHEAGAFWEMFKDTAKSMAVDLRDALNQFDDQSAATLQQYEDANFARKFAAEVQFSIKDRDTQKFLEDWKAAAQEVEDLVDEYNDVVTYTQRFFDFLDDEANSISDSGLRNDALAKIRAKRRSFNAALAEGGGGDQKYAGGHRTRQRCRQGDRNSFRFIYRRFENRRTR